MNLPISPAQYGQADQSALRLAIDQADQANYKRGADVELIPNARIIMYDAVSGARGSITVVSGVITWTLL